MISAAAKYLFDLNGYIVVRGVLSAQEVAVCNACIDRRQTEAKERLDEAVRNAKVRGIMVSLQGVVDEDTLGHRFTDVATVVAIQRQCSAACVELVISAIGSLHSVSFLYSEHL
jgi:adenosyl cobinamide kinase/adenosyl cobinamide phosphate guanylyltransferase